MFVCGSCVSPLSSSVQCRCVCFPLSTSHQVFHECVVVMLMFNICLVIVSCMLLLRIMLMSLCHSLGFPSLGSSFSLCPCTGLINDSFFVNIQLRLLRVCSGVGTNTPARLAVTVLRLPCLLSFNRSVCLIKMMPK